MTNSNHELRQAIADYAWNAWACLGVAGWRRRGFAACIDIDALVLLTGRLGDGDARLRDESLDWCASNLEYVARSRLVHLLKDGGAPGSWGAYAATLQHATKQSWPGSSQPFGWHPSGKSRLPQHADGATLALRARALFGATARAEAIRILMLDASENAVDAREVAVEASYTKRSVAQALASLEVAGLVRSTSVGNSHPYQLRRRAELEALLAPMPTLRTSQRAFCRVAWSVLSAAESAASATVRRVEGARLVRELASDLALACPQSRADDGRSPSLDDLLAWTVDACGTVTGRRIGA